MISVVGRIFAIWILLIIGLAGGWYSLDRLGLSSPTAPPFEFLPRSEAVLEATIQARLKISGGTVDASLVSLGQRMLTKAPLSPMPLALAGDEAVQRGDLDAARVAIQTALQRGPRNVGLQAWIAEDGVRAGNIDEVASRLALLIRIDPDRSDRYITALGRLAYLRGGRAALVRLLSTKPSWVEDLLVELNESHPDLAFLSTINAYSPKTQSRLLNRIIGEHGIQQAYATWRRFAEINDANEPNWPYDPEFTGAPGSPPFNWRLLGPATSFEPSNGLYVSYDGRGPDRLADQLLVLPPGSYELLTTALVSTRDRGGSLAWRIRCREGSGELARLQLSDSNDELKTYSERFSVPVGCDGQYLSLEGVPGELTLWSRAEMSTVHIKRTVAAIGVP